MAPHSSTPAWKIPWREEPGGLQSMGSLRARLHFHFHFSLSCIGEGNGDPLQYSCLENPRDRGAQWAAVYGVAQNWTRLKRLSSSSSSIHNIAFSGGSDNKESVCNAGDPGSIPGQEDPLEKGMATHSSILPWEIPRTEQPGGLQSMALQRVGHNLVNSERVVV